MIHHRLQLAAFSTLACATVAVAHTGQEAMGITGGLLHPISGLDHLLAAVAVGVLSAQLGGRSLWLLPMMFLSGMAIGGTAAFFGVSLPGVEWGIVLSLVALGLAIALRKAGPLGAAAAAVALLAIFHGHAHLAEYAAPPGTAAYVGGLFATTTLLHVVGVALATTFQRTKRLELVRIVGVIVLAIGLLKMTSVA
ncbi:MAG TPA: HupE/UreJ family protein [Tepidisphaeraceae bacterium]|jgi:urease accessory protein